MVLFRQRRRRFIINRRSRNTRRNTRQMLKPKIYRRGRLQLKQPVHYFTRYQNGGTITALATTTSTFGVMYWELASVPGFSEFTAMYDFYKINAVQANFIPLSNNSNYQNLGANAGLADYYNRIITVLDYNDRSIPTSLDSLRQYSNCKVTSNNIVHRRFLHPKPTIAMDEDSQASNVYGIAQAINTPWVSTASNQCEWYGIKFGIEHPAPGGDEDIYKVEFKIYLAFKGRN